MALESSQDTYKEEKLETHSKAHELTLRQPHVSSQLLKCRTAYQRRYMNRVGLRAASCEQLQISLCL